MSVPGFFEADWPAPAGVRAGTTLRSGGVSSGPFESLNLGDHVGDDKARVAANRARLSAALSLPAEPIWLSQVHGTRCVEATPSARGAEADASWSASPSTVLAIMTADCLPVVLALADGSRIAALHAGWRGLAAGVIEAAVDALAPQPARILAWLGPAISQPAFEVGDEVREAFLASSPSSSAHFEQNDRGRWQADLYGLARQRLSALGVTEVHGGGCCTYRDSAHYFSYRRERPCGRMATLIWRT